MNDYREEEINTSPPETDKEMFTPSPFSVKEAQILFFFFWPHHVACGILAPPRDRTRARTVEAWSLNHWAAREVPEA